jgi:hypothetical protein
MQHLIALDLQQHLSKCAALCLPNMQPHSWCALMRTACAARGDRLSDEHGASASSLLAHHYRRLAKLVHPDKLAGAAERDAHERAERAFKVLQEAYEQLLLLVSTSGT